MNSFFQDTTHHPSQETMLGNKLVEAARIGKRLGSAFLQRQYLMHLIKSGANLHFRDDLPFRTAVKENQTENALFLLNYPKARPVNVMANNASAFLNAAKNDNPILIGEISVRANGMLTNDLVYRAAETAVDGDCRASTQKLVEDFNLTAEQVGILRARATIAANDAMVKMIDVALTVRQRQQAEGVHQPSVDCTHPSVLAAPAENKAGCYLGAA